jgi:hypothetical protein
MNVSISGSNFDRRQVWNSPIVTDRYKFGLGRVKVRVSKKKKFLRRFFQKAATFFLIISVAPR